MDGGKPRIADCYPDEPSRKTNDSMFHVFGLSKGTHTLKVRVLGETVFDSKGTAIVLNDILVYE
jgi:hypothetical protein